MSDETTNTSSQTEDYLLRTATAADGYYLMPRGTAQNRELSFEARGMLAYIMSHPPNWRVMPTDLQQKKCGKNRVYRILNELIKAGYIIREPERNDDGTIKIWLYRVSDNPLPQNQELDNQELENGDIYKIVKEESSNKTNLPAMQKSAPTEPEWMTTKHADILASCHDNGWVPTTSNGDDGYLEACVQLEERRYLKRDSDSHNHYVLDKEGLALIANSKPCPTCGGKLTRWDDDTTGWCFYHRGWFNIEEVFEKDAVDIWPKPEPIGNRKKLDNMSDPFEDKNDLNAPRPTPIIEHLFPNAQPIVPPNIITPSGDIEVELRHEHVGKSQAQKSSYNCMAENDTTMNNSIDNNEPPGSLPSWWTKQHTAIIADCFVNGKAPLRNNVISNWNIAILNLIRQQYLIEQGRWVCLTAKSKCLHDIPTIHEAIKNRMEGKARWEIIKAKPKAKKKAKVNDNSQLSPEHYDLVAAIMQVWLHRNVMEFPELLPATQNNLRRVAGQLRKGGYTSEDVIWYCTEWLPQQGDWRKEATYNCMVGNGNSMDVAKAKANQSQGKLEILLDPSTFENRS